MSWQDQARCRGVNPNLFFPDRGDLAGVAYAKEVCAQCTVQVECLQYAIDTDQQLGIWGGVTRVGLQAARRARGRPPVAIEHGTNRGYAAHRRRGEPACVDCLRAHADMKFYRESA